MQTYQTLYSRDSHGKIRVWYMEIDHNCHRVTSGLEDGEKVTSGWTECEGKNLGKKNETTPERQAELEVDALYTKKMKTGYYESVDLIGSDDLFEPMLADKYAKFKGVFPVYSQPKLDGIRCIAKANGLFSRTGEKILSCPHIEEDLASFFKKYPNIKLDGELYNHKMKDKFEEIASAVRKTKNIDAKLTKDTVFYHVYDVSMKGPFESRTEFLGALENIACVHLVRTDLVKSQDELDDLYGEYLAEGYEGQMIRTPKSEYQNKRTKDLIKRKEFIDEEFKIVDVMEGLGNWSGYAKHLVVTSSDGREFKTGMRGDQEFLKKMLVEKKDYVGSDVTVRYQNLSSYGIPRFPIAVKYYKGQRKD